MTRFQTIKKKYLHRHEDEGFLGFKIQEITHAKTMKKHVLTTMVII